MQNPIVQINSVNYTMDGHYIQVQIDVHYGYKRTQIIVLNEYRTVVRGVLFDTYKRNPYHSPLVMQINDLAAAGWLKRIMTYHPYCRKSLFLLISYG